jgi:DNA-binding response OmpR family regulator
VSVSFKSSIKRIDAMTKRILIAEDDYSSREALTELAMHEGYDVISVADGVQLLSIINIGKFDVVITDLVMPDLNGVLASDIMKLKGDMTPVIAVTGLSSHDVRHVMDKFHRIYHKPINIKELFEYIRTLA